MIRTNKTLVLLSSFIAFFSAHNAYANRECPPHRPSTSLDYKVEKTQYLRNLSTDQLSLMHIASGPNTVLGLAGGQVGTEFEATFEVEDIGNNMYCLNLKKIDAVLFAKPQVHIAKNIRRGTCEYNAVLKHEDKHVETLKRAHKEYLPHYRKHLRMTSIKVPILPPMKLAEANLKKMVLIQHIKQDLSEYLNEIMKDVAERQAKVDSAREYQKVWDRCRKWEKRIAGE